MEWRSTTARTGISDVTNLARSQTGRDELGNTLDDLSQQHGEELALPDGDGDGDDDDADGWLALTYGARPRNGAGDGGRRYTDTAST